MNEQVRNVLRTAINSRKVHDQCWAMEILLREGFAVEIIGGPRDASGDQYTWNCKLSFPEDGLTSPSRVDFIGASTLHGLMTKLIETALEGLSDESS